MPAVCFSVFDHTTGPKPLFYPNLDQKMALKIAMKSQMTLSMMSQKTIETSDAVLPFPEEEKIAYVFLFTIKQKKIGEEDRSVASLSFIVGQDQQISFYKQVSLLRYQAEQIADMIRDTFEYAPDKSLPKNIEKTIEAWGKDLSSVEMTVEEEVRKKKITIRRSEKRGSISFLLNTIKKNPDKLVRAVVAGNTVILVGDEPLIDLMESTLEFFTPHRTLRKISYTEEFVHPTEAELIGMPPELAKHYQEEIIVDLRKGKIERGVNCKFSKKLLEQIKNLDQDKSERVIQSRINFLISKVNALVELAGGESVDDVKIKEFQKSVDKDALEIIIAIASQTNPMIADMLQDRVSAKYADWMAGL